MMEVRFQTAMNLSTQRMSGHTIILIHGIAVVFGNVGLPMRHVLLNVLTVRFSWVITPFARVNGPSHLTSISNILMDLYASGPQISSVTINLLLANVSLGSPVSVTFVCLNVKRTLTALMDTFVMNVTGV